MGYKKRNDRKGKADDDRVEDDDWEKELKEILDLFFPFRHALHVLLSRPKILGMLKKKGAAKKREGEKRWWGVRNEENHKTKERWCSCSLDMMQGKLELLSFCLLSIEYQERITLEKKRYPDWLNLKKKRSDDDLCSYHPSLVFSFPPLPPFVLLFAYFCSAVNFSFRKNERQDSSSSHSLFQKKNNACSIKKAD